MEKTKVLAKDIKDKWPLINEADLNRVLSLDILSDLVAKAYGTDSAKAHAEVTEWMGSNRSFT